MIYEQKHQKMPPSWCLFPQKCLMRSLAKDISLRVDIGEIWTANVSLYHLTKLWKKCRLLNIISTPKMFFDTDFTHKNYFGNVFFCPFPDLRQRNWEVGRLRLALIIWRHVRKLPSAKTRKNFKGVLFSFCAEEKYNTEVAVISTKTMNNSGHLTFLLTQQV